MLLFGGEDGGGEEGVALVGGGAEAVEFDELGGCGEEIGEDVFVESEDIFCIKFSLYLLDLFVELIHKLLPFFNLKEFWSSLLESCKKMQMLLKLKFSFFRGELKIHR